MGSPCLNWNLLVGLAGLLIMSGQWFPSQLLMAFHGCWFSVTKPTWIYLLSYGCGDTFYVVKKKTMSGRSPSCINREAAIVLFFLELIFFGFHEFNQYKEKYPMSRDTLYMRVLFGPVFFHEVEFQQLNSYFYIQHLRTKNIVVSHHSCKRKQLTNNAKTLVYIIKIPYNLQYSSRTHISLQTF